MPSTTELMQQRAKEVEAMREAVRKADEARKKGESAGDYDTEFDKAEVEERKLSRQFVRQQRVEALEKEAAGKHL